ncbi:MAG: isocitrate lyase/phosphoenolpyruvate mutase family protein [Brumimicrobium sp.]|nr:isocitrate lyase/phosphoenolpyruvate mutase family protein [Brumimicrobium sp.]MCO5267586.1 isocitrate lyase/phosphoenolpyruvate mutase family protein [Brumimicrobium sp.]
MTSYYDHFHNLHHQGNTFILPNAWDCTSAKIFEKEDFTAVGTTSSGIAWSCGYKDGEHIPADLMLRVLERMVKSIDIPLSADIEGGYYSGTSKEFAQFFASLMDIGVTGINIEDSHTRTKTLDNIKEQQDKISLIKSLAKDKGMQLFINARIDTLEYTEGDLQTKIQASVARAKAYQEAGADCIFVPFVEDMHTAQQLKEQIELPLNILAERSLDIAGLKTLHINRISTGSKPMMASLNLLKKAAHELKTDNIWETLMQNNTGYYEINNHF